MEIRRFAVLMGLLCGFVQGIAAEPAVIFDSGQAEPLSAIVEVPKPVDFSTLDIDKEKILAGIEEEMKGLKPTAIYPIESPGLTVGRVETKQVRMKQSFSPFFIVGDDAVSRQWMERNKNVLQKKNAQGLVAQVESEEKFKELQLIGSGLRLIPFPATALAKAFGVKNYPVYIGPDQITQ